MSRKNFKKFQSMGKVGLILLILSGIVSLSSLVRMSPQKIPALSDLPNLPLGSHQRLLIFAPHCDDETLGTAGVILAAKSEGLEVKVVIATNGDGYFFATAEDFKKIYPHPQDYIRMGELRQQESISALAILGVPASDVYFLSYPDRGSPGMWNDHWAVSDPYRSPYTGETRSPYPLTYDKGDVFSGEDYLGDIADILKSYRPDLIIYPHPEDVHPDHWGLNAFTRLAITLLENKDSAFRPDQFTYLVHRPDFPLVRGFKPQGNLLPPPAIYAVSPDWLRWDLSPEDVLLKQEAVHEYKSQLPLLRGLMESFIRSNELFAPVQTIDLVTLQNGDPKDPTTWTDQNNQVVPPIQLDPVHDFITRNAVPAADLTALFGARYRNELWICGERQTTAEVELVYSIRLKAITDHGLISYRGKTGELQSGWRTLFKFGRYFCTQIPLGDLGNPWAIYLNMESEGDGGTILDQSAWQMVKIGSAGR